MNLNKQFFKGLQKNALSRESGIGDEQVNEHTMNKFEKTWEQNR